jgi:hypothetical protein
LQSDLGYHQTRCIKGRDREFAPHVRKVDLRSRPKHVLEGKRRDRGWAGGAKSKQASLSLPLQSHAKPALRFGDKADPLAFRGQFRAVAFYLDCFGR